MSGIGEFQTLIGALTIRCTYDEGFLEELTAIGVNEDHWPEGEARSVMSQFRRDFSERGYRYAAWFATEKNMAFDRLKENTPAAQYLPNDRYVVRELYQAQLTTYRALAVAHRAIENPADAHKILQEFDLPTKADELVNVAGEMSDAVSRYNQRAREKRSVTEVPGWPLLSQAIGGFNPARLGILIAGTGFGKSTFALNIAMSAARSMSVAFINMEMDRLDMYERVFARVTGKHYQALRREGADADEMQRFFADRPNLYMSSGRDKSVREIFALCRNLRRRLGALGLVIVDYDQKLVLDVSRSTPEWMALQKAMVELESLAKEVGCFVLVLAQSTEDGEISGSKRSKFPASVVARFFEDANQGAVVHLVKNRFGSRGAAIGVSYDQERATVTEERLIPKLESSGPPSRRDRF